MKFTKGQKVKPIVRSWVYSDPDMFELHVRGIDYRVRKITIGNMSYWHPERREHGMAIGPWKAINPDRIYVTFDEAMIHANDLINAGRSSAIPEDL